MYNKTTWVSRFLAFKAKSQSDCAAPMEGMTWFGQASKPLHCMLIEGLEGTAPVAFRLG